MLTQLAKESEAKIISYKKYASENQFNQMIEGIKTFDINLTGFGFESIQAKLKLNYV